MKIPKPTVEQVGTSSVYVRAMTFRQFTAYQDEMDENDPEASTAALIRHTVCDADGKLAFANGTAPAIEDWPARFVLEVCEASMKLNLPPGDYLGNSASVEVGGSHSA